jgi:hypothetical protein
MYIAVKKQEDDVSKGNTAKLCGDCFAKKELILNLRIAQRAAAVIVSWMR